MDLQAATVKVHPVIITCESDQEMREPGEQSGEVCMALLEVVQSHFGSRVPVPAQPFWPHLLANGSEK